MTRIKRVCPTCGHVGTYKTVGLADHHFARHSCERALAQAATAKRVAERATASGPERPCTHKRAHHPHGNRLRYVLDKCRCRPCRDAAADYERKRARLRASVAWGTADDPLVDAELARRHVRALMAQGMGLKRIKKVSGVGQDTLGALLYGKFVDDPSHPDHRPRRKRITRRVHDALMAVELDLADGARIDSTGTARRLQALVVVGWSKRALAKLLGIQQGNMHNLFTPHLKVTVGTARRAKDLYDRLWDTEPPTGTRYQRISVTKAKAYAKAQRFAPPLAWDDDTIDDPRARPHGIRKDAA